VVLADRTHDGRQPAALELHASSLAPLAVATAVAGRWIDSIRIVNTLARLGPPAAGWFRKIADDARTRDDRRKRRVEVAGVMGEALVTERYDGTTGRYREFVERFQHDRAPSTRLLVHVARRTLRQSRQPRT
jgi:hypothetical protein